MPQNMAPYKILKRGEKFVVVNNGGEVKGTHDSLASAERQLRALYTNVPRAQKIAENKPWTGKQKNPARVKAQDVEFKPKKPRANPPRQDFAPAGKHIFESSAMDADLCKLCGQGRESENHMKQQAAVEKPYGDVTYADPGYQKDGKKRYPLNNADRVRSAWSYINQAGNAAKYTAEQRERIKSRIKAAAKRFGINIESEKAEQLDRLTRLYGPQVAEIIAEPPVPLPVVDEPITQPINPVPPAEPVEPAEAPILAPSELPEPPAQTARAVVRQPLREGESPDVPAERAFVTEVNGKTLITGRASAFELEKAMAGNPHFLWMQGRFVGAEKANRNGAFWTTGDLELGQVSVKHGPLNWLHEARHVIGTIAHAELVTRDERVMADLEQPHIQATSAVWKWIYPDEAWVIEQASDQGKLWYSMECVSKEVACVGEGGCGAKASYMDYLSHKGETCQHMRERSGVRHFAEPTFLGGAVIVPPVRPGWAEADATVLRQAASLAPDTFNQAGRPDVAASEWEQLMAQVLRFAWAGPGPNLNE